ncbi:MAG: hypothetical protein COA79_10880 [Planctomycetota bacterium]|nr:MAG: hypothetical protein COA79_10880 [Planctomycetota bacterium]
MKYHHFLTSLIFALLLCNSLTAQDLDKIVLKNDRNIMIDYLVEKHEKLTKVELYFTRDEGETWTLFGEDADLKPPFLFVAKSEGLYGFKVVTYDKNKNHIEIPNSNTAVEVPYFIDTIKPKVSIRTPMLGAIWRVGDKVDIKWYATDDGHDLPLNPVSISYSKDKGHTWQFLRKIHPNTGSLEDKWLIDERLISKELLIKISVIDQAKNYSEIISDSVQVIGKDDKVAEVYYIKLSDRVMARKLWKTGTMLLGREDYFDALLALHKAIHLDPTKVAYHFDMAVAYGKIGDYKKSQIKYMDAVKIIEDRNSKSGVAIRVYLGYTVFLHKIKETNKEKEVIDKILKIDPMNETAMWYLALLYEERKNIDEAKNLWKKIAISERNKPNGSMFPKYSLWRIQAKEKLMKYVSHPE